MSHRPGSLDGQVLTQGGREWTIHEDQDDDGRWTAWSECGECGGTARFGDDARDAHECEFGLCEWATAGPPYDGCDRDATYRGSDGVALCERHTAHVYGA